MSKSKKSEAGVEEAKVVQIKDKEQLELFAKLVALITKINPYVTATLLSNVIGLWISCREDIDAADVDWLAAIQEAGDKLVDLAEMMEALYTENAGSEN